MPNFSSNYELKSPTQGNRGEMKSPTNKSNKKLQQSQGFGLAYDKLN